MVRRCVNKLIQSVEKIIEEELMKKERQRRQEMSLRRERRKALIQQKKDRKGKIQTLQTNYFGLYFGTCVH